MNRHINQEIMNQSKDKTIDYVLSEITVKPKNSFLTKTRIFLFSMTSVVILIVVLLSIPSTSAPQPVLTQQYESEAIAEVSYLTANLLFSTATISETSHMNLSTVYNLSDEETEFEENEEMINLYFDTLRVFLEEDLFSETVQVEVSEDDPNTYIITFQSLGDIYELVVTFTERNFTGTLEVNQVIYQVSGKVEESDTEFNLTFEAEKDESYMKVEYKTEAKENEVEHKYEITQNVNNTEYKKEVKVSREQNEFKVEITENQNQYQLKKETEDGQNQYKLEYNIEGINGEAIITESSNANGETTYQYQIKEGSVEKDITKGKPESNNGNSSNNGNNQQYIGVQKSKEFTT